MCEYRKYRTGRRWQTAMACGALVALAGCAAKPVRQEIAWGGVPVPAGETYALAPWAGDPAIVAQVEHCLADIGLHPAARPRFLVELAYTRAPARVGVDGVVHDEPQPYVVAGKLPRGRAEREALTLVITDFASGQDQLRARLIERKPGPRAHGQPALGATLCGFVRSDHSALH